MEDVHVSQEEGGDLDTSCLDHAAFPLFTPLLKACEDYASLSGCRFQGRAFAHIEHTTEKTPIVDARSKAAPVVADFLARLRAGDEGLSDSVTAAYQLVMDESVRNGMIATCRELQLWPANTPEVDRNYLDFSASLPTIAKRVYNEDVHRRKDPRWGRKATTASFLVDFAGEAGVVRPNLVEQSGGVLQEFLALVDRWTIEQECSLAKAVQPRRSVRGLLMGLVLGVTAEALRRHAQPASLWSGRSAVLLLAVVVGVAIARRSRRPPRS
jgi:hypothetical protein